MNVPVAWFRDKRSEKGTPIFLLPIWLSQAGSRLLRRMTECGAARIVARVPKTAANVLILLRRRQRHAPPPIVERGVVV